MPEELKAREQREHSQGLGKAGNECTLLIRVLGEKTTALEVVPVGSVGLKILGRQMKRLVQRHTLILLPNQ